VSTPAELLAGNQLHVGRFSSGDLAAPLRRHLAIVALALDVATIRTSPLLPPDLEVNGFRYDVRTGRVDPVG